MYIDVIFSPLELESRGDISQKSVAVIDTLRATSTITYALWGYDNTSNTPNGCVEVIPVKTIKEAFFMAEKYKHRGALLAGERFCLKPEGFDLGNSPDEYTVERVKGKTIVYTTTNGTQALNMSKDANFVTTASLVNAESCVEALFNKNNDVLVFCAGRSKKTTIEDSVCAGLVEDLLVEKCDKNGIDYKLSDAAMIARDFYEIHKNSIKDLLMLSEAGNNLVEVNLEKDIEVCCKINSIPLATEYKDGILSLLKQF